ncbi:hypothetical protein GDO81_025010 [Engystomops pustulosus]|uniref:Uncharacterized protein n=1 Tax=Engystomops pustulosus TaxID=76066 RepID=A0AAV6YTP9_ENGPU|nr:hypothetical protein GDO81_025010 [Engystomops pustulosus]
MYNAWPGERDTQPVVCMKPDAGRLQRAGFYLQGQQYSSYYTYFILAAHKSCIFFIILFASFVTFCPCCSLPDQAAVIKLRG